MIRELRCIGLALVLGACHPQGELPSGPQPAILQHLLATHAFDRMLPDGWRTERLFAMGPRIRIELRDASGQEHSIELLPDAPGSGKVDGRGNLHVFRFVHGADSARDAQLLLWAAGVVDGAMAETRTGATAGTPRPEPRPTESPRPTLSGLKGMGAIQPSSGDSAGAAGAEGAPTPAGGDGAPITEPGLTAPKALVIALGVLESLVVITAAVMGLLLSGALFSGPEDDVTGS
jgi:hypothetical protein